MHSHATNSHTLSRTHSTYSLRSPRADHIRRPTTQRNRCQKEGYPRRSSGPSHPSVVVPTANVRASTWPWPTAPPEYVLKAAEAAIQARGGAKRGRMAIEEVESSDIRSSGDTLVHREDDKVKKTGRSSMISGRSMWDETNPRAISSSKEIESYEDSLTGLLAPSEIEDPRSSIRIRIWETESIMDLLQPCSAPAFKSNFHSSEPEYISSMYVEGETDASLGRRLVVAWKSASALTRKFFAAGVSSRGVNKRCEEMPDSDGAVPCEFEIVHGPMTNQQDL